MSVAAGGAVLIDPRVFCNDGVNWQVKITAEYESGGTWHNFVRSGLGTSALITMPVNACTGQDHYTNDSAHDLSIFYLDGATCAVEGDSGPDAADVPHTLTPNACNQTNERVEYDFVQASNGATLSDFFVGPSHPSC